MVYKYRCFAIITPVIFLLDQLTKWWIVRTIPYGQGFPVIPGYCDLVHVHNTGAAFGMLAGAHATWREPFFYAVSLIATGVIVAVARSLGPRDRLVAVILALVLGGVLGNLLDRIRFGWVIDFVSVHWRDVVVRWHLGRWQWQLPLEWPAFNVADSAITVSMVLLAWHFLNAPKGEV